MIFTLHERCMYTNTITKSAYFKLINRYIFGLHDLLVFVFFIGATMMLHLFFYGLVKFWINGISGFSHLLLSLFEVGVISLFLEVATLPHLILSSGLCKWWNLWIVCHVLVEWCLSFRHVLVLSLTPEDTCPHGSLKLNTLMRQSLMDAWILELLFVIPNNDVMLAMENHFLLTGSIEFAEVIACLRA